MFAWDASRVGARLSEVGLFEWLGAELEKRTSMSLLEARGTVRLVLRDAGLDVSTVRTHQLIVVVERLMAPALKKRGVEDVDALCHALAHDLRAREELGSDSTPDSAYDVFERLDVESSRRPKK